MRTLESVLTNTYRRLASRWNTSATALWSLVVLSAILLALVTSTASLFRSGTNSEPIQLCTAWCLFVLLAAAYLRFQGLRDLAWCRVPVLLTFQATLGFVLSPIWLFASGAEEMDVGYVHAMFLALIGFGAFWTGSCLFMKEKTGRDLFPRHQITLGG